MRTHLKHWLDTPLKDIKRDVVKDLHNQITAKGNRARANQVIVTGGAVYTFARVDLEEPDLPALSPWRSRKLFHKLKPRQTGLATASIPGWFEKVGNLNDILREANLFALPSALRLTNLVSLRWDQINVRERCLNLGADSTKGGETFRMPLSRAMLRCLWRARKASRMLHEVNASTWVFASDRSRTGHISNVKNIQSWTRADGTKHKKVRTEQSAHALRHTWRDCADRSRIPAVHSKVLMGHAIPSDVHSEYLSLGNMFDDLRLSQEAVSRLIVKNLVVTPEAGRGLT